MSAPGGDGAGADVRLVEVPDMATALKRDWPRIALRASVAVLVPLFTTLLIDAFDLVAQLQQFVPVISFLNPGTDGYGLRVVAFLVLVLVVASFVIPKRVGQLLLGLSTIVILAVGFNNSQLQWTKLWAFGFDSFVEDGPPAAAWVWAVLLLGTVTVYILLEELLDTRRQQAERELPADDTRAVQRVAAQAVGITLAGGAALAGTIVGLVALLSPAATEQLLGHLNPVYVLLALGVVLVGAVVLAARRSRSEAPPVQVPLVAPPPPPGFRRVPVEEGSAPPPPPPPPPPPRR